MNERHWERLERQLIEAHVAADRPPPGKIWRGVEAALAARRARRGVGLALGAVVLATAAIVALWFLPGSLRASRTSGGTAMRHTITPAEGSSDRTASGAPGLVASAKPAAGGVSAGGASAGGASAAGRASATDTASAMGTAARPLNQVIEPTRAVTFVMAADAGRIEIEPCRGRFVNVTVLGSPHRSLELAVEGQRVEVRLDGGAMLASGVAHVLVPADTHLVLSTRSGPIVVRGLGGPMEIDSQGGEVRVDRAPRADPRVTITSDGGAIAWQGRCGSGCRVDARSRLGDITLRAPDRSVFARGAVRGQSEQGRVHLEELTCTDPRCSSSPLPWRQLAPGQGH
jgi:hypothetical protein